MKFSNFRRPVAVFAMAAVAALGLAACSSDAANSGNAGGDTGEVDFPTKSVTLIVPYAAGGPTDISARALAQDLEAELGKTVIVENRPGASGITGLSEVATAKADGYTITYTTGDSFVQSELREGVPFSFDSFIPVAGTITQPYVLVTGKDQGIADFAELEKLSNATYAVTGVGTPTHLNTAMLFDQLGVQATAVPFDGASPAVQALVGGQTNVAMLDVSVAMPFVTSGDLKALAVYTPDNEHLDYLEGVQTLEEHGVDTDSMTLTVWGVAAPAGTDAAIVEKLRTAALAAAEGSNFQTFTQANYMPLLTPEAEATWYEDLQATAKKSVAALEKFGISLS
ncbi:MAG: tripartite tricarboxylate transporter substrate binding protein [Leucobacter sp.]|jgi:tripartite-type tricarboxylate transporter receptor subunit TctC|nr:tripartite tricarboxylate transporter substrate binding protein [Leucobacter sp.]